DGAEAAVEGAAPRCFYNVHRTADQRVACEHTRVTIRQCDRFRRQLHDRAIRIVSDDGPVTIREACDSAEISMLFERTQKLAQRPLAFSRDEKVTRVSTGIGVWCQPRIVAARHDPRRWSKTTNQPRNPERGRSLEGHYRQADDIGFELVDESGDR